MVEFNTQKETKNRYARGSVNWGSIAVAPADLVEAYRELSIAREAFVSCSQGGVTTRTTSLAHARRAVKGLALSGYKKGEIAAILAILASE